MKGKKTIFCGDIGIGGNDAAYVGKMCGLIVLLGVCGLCFAVTCQYLAARCGYRYGRDLRNALFHHIGALSCNELDGLGTSTLINRITNDVTASQQGVNMFIRLASRAPFLVLGAIVMTLLIDWQLSLIFLVIAPILGFILEHGLDNLSSDDLHQIDRKSTRLNSSH